MNCSECGMVMEHGFIRSESFIGGIKWMQERSTKSMGLETVVKPDAGGFCFLEGYRCQSCHRIVVGY